MANSADQIATVNAALDATGVYIDPTLSAQVDADELAAISSSIAAAGSPVYVVALPLDYDDEYGGNPRQVAALLHDDTPHDGAYLVVDDNYGSGWRIDQVEYGVVTDAYEATYVAGLEEPDDLGAQLALATKLMADGTADERYSTALAADDREDPPSSSDGGSGHTTLIVVLSIIGAVLALAVIRAITSAVRGSRPSAESRRGLKVDRSVLRRFSAAQSGDWRRRAERSTLDLGERIDATDITDESDPDAWQAALDHYEAARRVLDRSDSAADAVGALVLARRGDQALTSALASKPWQPKRTCFFNPLHQPGSQTVTWKLAGTAVEVPCCPACAKAARKSGAKPDILDLPVDGTVRPYFETSAEPWASTGYGSLDPDLLSRL